MATRPPVVASLYLPGSVNLVEVTVARAIVIFTRGVHFGR